MALPCPKVQHQGFPLNHKKQGAPGHWAEVVRRGCPVQHDGSSSGELSGLHLHHEYGGARWRSAAEPQAGAERLPCGGQHRTSKEVERSDSTTVVTTLTCNSTERQAMVGAAPCTLHRELPLAERRGHQPGSRSAPAQNQDERLLPICGQALTLSTPKNSASKNMAAKRPACDFLLQPRLLHT